MYAMFSGSVTKGERGKKRKQKKMLEYTDSRRDVPKALQDRKWSAYQSRYQKQSLTKILDALRKVQVSLQHAPRSRRSTGGGDVARVLVLRQLYLRQVLLLLPVLVPLGR